MIMNYLSSNNRTSHPDHGFGQSTPINEILLQVKDALYSSGETLKQIFGKCYPDMKGNVEREHFITTIMHVYGAPATEADLVRAFDFISHGDKVISFKTFTEVLAWEEEFHDIEVVRKIRSWMYKGGLSSEQAFEKLCHIKHNHTDKRLTR